LLRAIVYRVRGYKIRCPQTRRSRQTDANDDASKEALVASGKVKWFNPTKGYGFIQPNDGTRDVFVHISAVQRAGLSTLNEGQDIEYEMVTNRGKQSAENLKVR